MDLGFWLLERAFTFESKAPLFSVVRAIKSLKSSSWARHDELEVQALVVDDTIDAYAFRYVVRHATRVRFFTTAYVEGRAWQRRDGVVVVEGTARVNPWELYGGLLVTVIIGCFMMANVRHSILRFPLVWMLTFVGWTGFWIWLYVQDRNHVITRIAEALAPMLIEPNADA
jgi:hypothetical protein